jgi:tetratricopeptide (TPR) repeat protein
MKALRVVLALLVVVAVTAAIALRIAPRIGCNREKGRINREVRRFSDLGDEYLRLRRARNNIAACQRCLALYPEDYQLHALLGANLRILGQPEEAVRSYERALALTERPELYSQIGEIEIERGNVAAARAALLRAGTLNVMWLETVEQPLRGELYDEVLARHDRLRHAQGITDRPPAKRRPRLPRL